jgi:AcrR family transcriptional regulator
MSKKSDIVKAEIIDAARKVLSSVGVQNMTLQAVADAASISKGALYYYYKTKDDILYEIMEQDNAHSRRIAGRVIQQNNELDVDELKREITTGVLNRFPQIDKNKLNLYLQGEALKGNTELQKKYNEKYHEWIENIDRIITRIYGVEPSPVSRAISTISLAAVEGICIQMALMDKPEVDGELIGRILMLILSIDYKEMEERLRKDPSLSFL